jgi:SAM-dependent methyltransferase
MIATTVFVLIVFAVLFIINWLSYNVLKKRCINAHPWDLNVCCGKTDGGGVNTDIVKHANIPNLVLSNPLYLPFKDKSFGSVVCSHAAEHIQDPKALMEELNRVGYQVTLIVPPLWDFAAALNILEHKWLFVCFKKVYRGCLPPHIRLPMARTLQRLIGQRIKA